MKISTVTLWLAGALWLTGCKGTQEQDSMTMGKGAAITSSSGLSINNGGLSIHENQVGVVFGPSISPSATPGLRYMLLLKHKTGGLQLSGVTNGTGSLSQGVYSDLDVMLNGVGVSTRYQAALNEKEPGSVSESLTFNGTPVNLTDGNLLLVDVSGTSASWTQTTVTLPTLPEHADPARMDALAKQSVAQLAQQSPLVRDFVR